MMHNKQTLEQLFKEALLTEIEMELEKEGEYVKRLRAKEIVRNLKKGRKSTNGKPHPTSTYKGKAVITPTPGGGDGGGVGKRYNLSYCKPHLTSPSKGEALVSTSHCKGKAI